MDWNIRTVVLTRVKLQRRDIGWKIMRVQRDGFVTIIIFQNASVVIGCM